MSNKILTRVLTLLVFVGISITSSAQIRYQEEAEQAIKDLKNGALLVRLQDRGILVSQLKERGRIQEMNAVIANTKERNQKYVKAFKQGFDFCEVYFFTASESGKLKQKMMDEIVFLDKNLEPNPSIEMTAENFFVAEFINLESDPEQVSVKSGNNDKEVYKKSDMGFHALVIKDSAFDQLKRPFPFYTKTLESLPFKRSDKKVIQIMNEKLWGYYKKVTE